MQIAWIKCSEQMPPNDLNCAIITFDSNGYCADDGKCLNSIKEFCLSDNTIWTAFTKEKWDYLNRIYASNPLKNGDSVNYSAQNGGILNFLSRIVQISQFT